MRYTFFFIFALAIGLAAFRAPQQADAGSEAEKIFAAGEQLYNAGKYQRAADTLKRSTAIFEQLKQTTLQIRSANLQAECLSNLNQCDVAASLLKRSLDMLGNRTKENQQLLADTYYYLARNTGGCARKFDEAIKIMGQSIKLKKEIYSSDDPALAFDYTFLGYIYNSKGKYDSALMYLDQAVALRKKQVQQDDGENAQMMFNLAASYEGKSELGKALQLNLDALNLRKQKLGMLHASVSNSVNSIGRVYRKLGNNERALEYYQQALDIRKKTLGETHPNVAASYYEIGNLYGNTSGYHEALEYIQQGNRILENNTQVVNDVLPTYIAYAAKMYGLTSDHENAKAHIKKSIGMAEKTLAPTHPYRAIVYNIAAEYYGDNNDIKMQSEFAKKAIAIYQAAYGAGSEREGDVIAKLADTYSKLGDTNEALKFYNEALMIYTGKVGAQNPKVATVHLGMANLYANKDFSTANRSYQQALASIGLNENSPVETIDNKPLAIKIVRGEADLLYRNSDHEPGKLKEALDAYRLALQLSSELMQTYSNDEGRIRREKDRKELATATMNVLWEMYSLSKQTSVIDEAFQLSENSKATLLMENMRDQRAKTIAGVPDSLVERERDMRVELAYYKASLYKSQKGKDTAAAGLFQKQVFESTRQLEQFKSTIQSDFPVYYQAKFNTLQIAIADIQKHLNPNETVAQYFVGDNAMWCFLLTSNSVQFRREPLTNYVRYLVRNYQKGLTDLSFIINNPVQADTMLSYASAKLFSKLMLPKPTGNSAEKLIIVPDDFLTQLNFGALLCKPAGDGIPLLGMQTRVSYAYSSSLLSDQFKRKQPLDGFAGFAPSYEMKNYASVDSVAHPLSALAMRSGNFPLPGAAAEVRTISDMMQGTSWLDDNATETNFKKHSPEYGVLHLAMHSMLNNDEPEYSELLFANGSDEENDGYLTISEIYNLKLNAQLVVLSACSSGAGKIQHGEGAISLSRAFSYAGCPSVVMSLWKVPDAVTTTIMTEFYKNLDDGLAKDEALRSAQLKFITENKDPLYDHPYYWAGFVVMGDTSPLQKTPSMVLYFISGAFLIGVAIFFVRRRKDSRG